LKTGLITNPVIYCDYDYVVFKTKWLLLLFAVFPDLDPAMTNIIIPPCWAVLSGNSHCSSISPWKYRKIKINAAFYLFISWYNIIGNYVFIPRIGVIASAYTMIVSGSVYSLFSMLASGRIWTVRVAK
jgi:hypothetical protein